MTSEPCSVWEGGDMLALFLRNDAAEHIPRPTTGKIPVRTEGYVMTVQADETLPDVFRKLTTEGFLGAPVCSGSQLVGHVTQLDLVKYVNGLFFATTEEDWAEFWQKKLLFATATARSIIDVPDEYMRNPFLTMTSDFTSFSALEMMARYKNHQILLTDKERNLCGILTQSMLISFLRQNKGKWDPNFGKLKVSDFEERNEGKKKLVTVTEDELAINAFLRMEMEEVHGMPIVDKEGVLTGCISVRDLRGVGTDGAQFFRLYRPVRAFKELCQESYGKLAPRTHYTRKKLPEQPVYVTPEDSMEDVIDRMEDGNLHRVFICTAASHANGRPKPIGVISQSDVLYQTLMHIIRKAGGTELTFKAVSQARLGTRKISPMKKKTAWKPEPTEEKSVSPPGKRSIPISFA